MPAEKRNTLPYSIIPLLYVILQLQESRFSSQVVIIPGFYVFIFQLGVMFKVATYKME